MPIFVLTVGYLYRRKQVIMAIVDRDDFYRFPQYGWEYEGMRDLMKPIATCSYCGTDGIRYLHYIHHKDWGTITVGSGCAARLTQSDEAYKAEKDRKQYLAKLDRYMNSKRWKQRKNGNFYSLEEFIIKIWDHQSYANLEIDYPTGKMSGRFHEYKTLKSRQRYESIDAAKLKAFEVIEKGELRDYIATHEK